MTQYLQMLLNRKRPDPNVPYDDPNDIQPDQQDAGSTIPIRSVPRPLGSPTPTQFLKPLAQQPTAPVSETPVVAPTATIPLSARPSDAGMDMEQAPPRDVIGEDRQRLINAQSKHHSNARDILEGLGQYAASGVGLNLHKIIYPHGTETEQAQRQLATDLGLQKQQTENQDQQSIIALRSSQTKENEAQTRKIQDAIDNPDTSDEDKRKLEALRESLKMHPQPFDANDPNDVELLKRAKDAGILIPSAYGRQPKPEAGFTLAPGQIRFDANGKPIANLPATEKPEKGETPEQLGVRTRNFNAANEKFKSLMVQEQNAAKEKDKAYAELSNLRSKNADEVRNKVPVENATITKSQIVAAEKRAEEAQKFYESFGGKKTEARAEILKHADGTDASGEPIAPKQSSSPNSNGLTIEGAIKHFEKLRKRKPNQQEIDRMQAALAQ